MIRYKCPKCGEMLAYQESPCHGCDSPVIWEGIQGPRASKAKMKVVVLSVLAGLIAVSVPLFLFLGGPQSDKGFVSDSIELGSIVYKEAADEDYMTSDRHGTFIANQVILDLDDNQSRDLAEKYASEAGGTIVGEIEFVHLYQIELPTADEKGVNQAIELLQKKEGVERVFANSTTALLSMNPDSNESGELEDYAKSIDSEGSAAPQTRQVIQGERCPETIAMDSNLYGGAYRIIGLQEAYDLLTLTKTAFNPVTIGIADELVNTAHASLVDIPIDGETHMLLKPRNDDTFEDNVVYHPLMTHGTSVANILAANPSQSKLVGVTSILKDKIKIKTINLHKLPLDKLGVILTDKPGSRFNEKGDYEKADSSADTSNAYVFNDDFIKKFNQALYERHVKDDPIKSDIFGTLVELSQIIDSGATIVNCSYGVSSLGSFKDQCDAYTAYLTKLNAQHPYVLIVAAAGNENGGLDGANDFWGKALPNLITVGSVDSSGAKAAFSNYAVEGGEVTLAAPGEKIPVAVQGYEYIQQSGTSFSAPIVTGAAAILRSINPKLSAAEIKSALVSTAAVEPAMNFDQRLGKGILRVDEAALKVINDLRQQKNLKPYSKDDILELKQVHLTLEGSDKDYTMTVELKSVPEGGASVTIQGDGRYMLTGEPTQTLNAPGKLTWKVGFFEEPVTLHAKRDDSQGCSVAYVSPIPYEGSWEGTFTLSGVNIPYQLTVSKDHTTGKYQVQGEILPGDIKQYLEDVENLSDWAIEQNQQLKDWIQDSTTFGPCHITEDKTLFYWVKISMAKDMTIRYVFSGKINEEGEFAGDLTDRKNEYGTWRMRRVED